MLFEVQQLQWRVFGILWVILTFALFSEGRPIGNNTPEVKLPESFKAEAVRLKQAGFKLRDFLYPFGYGDFHYAVAILDAPDDSNGRVSELRGYRPESEGLRLVSREVVERRTLAFHEMNNTDINGDGKREIVVWKACSGTAWSCGQFGVYQFRNHRLIDLTKSINGTLFPSSLVDLNGDGVMEIIAIDARWETYEHLPHVTAPFVEEIFTWSTGNYRQASEEFPAFYIQRINELTFRITQVDNSYEYLGNVIRLLLNYDRMGATQQGWMEFRRLLQTGRPTIVETEVWRSIKDLIRNDFETEFSTPPDRK